MFARTAGGASGQALSNSSILFGAGVSVPMTSSHGRSHLRGSASDASSAQKGQARAGAASPRRSRKTSIRGLPAAAAARNARSLPRLFQASSPCGRCSRRNSQVYRGLLFPPRNSRRWPSGLENRRKNHAPVRARRRRESLCIPASALGRSRRRRWSPSPKQACVRARQRPCSCAHTFPTWCGRACS